MTASSPSSNVKYVATLAAASALILVLGYGFRPRPESPQPPVASDAEIRNLTRLTQRRSIENATNYFASLADDVAPALVRLPELDASGVVWRTGLVSTTRLDERFAPGTTIQYDGETVAATGVAWTPHSRLVGLEWPQPAGAVLARRPLSFPRVGESVAVVWRPGGGERIVFTPTSFVARTTVVCEDVPNQVVSVAVPLTRAMAGGGLFDLDGNILALITRCDSGYVAVVPEQVDAALTIASTAEARLLAHYGLVLDSLTDAEAAYFKTASGAVVREVWADLPAAAAGMLPGEIIVAIDGSDVATPAAAQELLVKAAGAATMTVVRGQARREVRLASDPVAAPADGSDSMPSGLVWAAPTSGYAIRDVLAGSRAAAVGVRAGDRVTRIGFVVPRDAEQARQALENERRRPAFVEFERGRRRWGALLG